MGQNIDLDGLLKQTGSKRVTPSKGKEDSNKVGNAKYDKTDKSFKQWSNALKKLVHTRNSTLQFRKKRDNIAIKANLGLGINNKK